MELKEGTWLQDGKYQIVKKLGQGSFGITYLAMFKFSSHVKLGKLPVAIKEFFMTDFNSRQEDGSTVEGTNTTIFQNYRKKFRKEAENLAKLDHQNIVKVYDVFDENGTSYYSMEYINGENLDDYISSHNPLDEQDVVDIFRDICDALACMHSCNMLHLDIKPKNIMRSTQGHISLIDFGLSKQFTENGEPESSTTIGLGTPGYAPLEQAKFIKDGTFPATLDIYALGATLYKLLTGKRPSDASDILNDGLSLEQLVEANRSQYLIDIVEKSMAPIKKYRYQNISDIIALLPIPEKQEEPQVAVPEDEQTEVSIDKGKKKKQRFNIKPDLVSIDLYTPEYGSTFLHISRTYGIRGENDIVFTQKGLTKLTVGEYNDFIAKLNKLINTGVLTECAKMTVNVLVMADNYLFEVDPTKVKKLLDIIPYSEKYQLNRFLPPQEEVFEEEDEGVEYPEDGQSQQEIPEWVYVEDEIEEEDDSTDEMLSKFYDRVNRFTEKHFGDNTWIKDLIYSLGILVVAIMIFFLLFMKAATN